MLYYTLPDPTCKITLGFFLLYSVQVCALLFPRRTLKLVNFGSGSADCLLYLCVTSSLFSKIYLESTRKWWHWHLYQKLNRRHRGCFPCFPRVNEISSSGKTINTTGCKMIENIQFLSDFTLPISSLWWVYKCKFCAQVHILLFTPCDRSLCTGVYKSKLEVPLYMSWFIIKKVFWFYAHIPCFLIDHYLYNLLNNNDISSIVSQSGVQTW